MARLDGQTAADTPRRLDASVRATPLAAWQARRAIRRLALPPPLGDDAELLVSELVTNSVRHAGLSPDDLIRITADWSGTRLKVAVAPAGACCPRRSPAPSGPPPGGVGLGAVPGQPPGQPVGDRRRRVLVRAAG